MSPSASPSNNSICHGFNAPYSSRKKSAFVLPARFLLNSWPR
jgi:hypothetical protein